MQCLRHGDAGFFCDGRQTERTLTRPAQDILGDRRVTARERVEEVIKGDDCTVGTAFATRHALQHSIEESLFDENNLQFLNGTF